MPGMAATGSARLGVGSLARCSHGGHVGPTAAPALRGEAHGSAPAAVPRSTSTKFPLRGQACQRLAWSDRVARLSSSLGISSSLGASSALPAKRHVAVCALLEERTEQRGLAATWRSDPASFCLQDNVGPNSIVLEAQAKVCTGPTQTRPLTEEHMRQVLATVLASVKGELPDEEKVSLAQMGAFFGAMALRHNAFPEATTWQDGERRAMEAFWPELRVHLPPEVAYLADPEGTIFATPGTRYSGGESAEERRVVTALREVLQGGHLGFEETHSLLRDILPLRARGERVGPGVSDALVAAYLICQRMNRETDRELKAFCFAFDQETGPAPVANVESLTHYGEPYDGSTRFFRPTLFAAAVRASYGESCLLHGVPWMPPKGGVTEEQQLSLLGAATTLTPKQAAAMLEEVGMAYVSQREGSPSLYSLQGMRLHIKKRPTFATTEKLPRFVHATGRESMMAGFYHEGYEEPLLMLMRRMPVAGGLVIKGEEGSLALMTRLQGADAVVKGRPVNFCAGFRPATSGGGRAQGRASEPFTRETFELEVDAASVGIAPSNTPRTDRSASKNLKLGMAALSGEKGPVYDRIVFNAAVADHLLGCQGAQDLRTAVERAKDAIDSGRAIATLLKYAEESCKFED